MPAKPDPLHEPSDGDETILLEDLAPKRDVKGGGTILFGEQAAGEANRSESRSDEEPRPTAEDEL
jgi:hypothetical protein